VVEVTGNNAKKAGFQPGDLIYYLEDTKITSGAQLVGLIQKKEIGDKVTFSVVRNNEIVEITLELEDSQSIQPSQLTQPQAGQQQGQ